LESASERDSILVEVDMSESSHRGARRDLEICSRENATRSKAAQVEDTVRERDALF